MNSTTPPAAAVDAETNPTPITPVEPTQRSEEDEEASSIVEEDAGRTEEEAVDKSKEEETTATRKLRPRKQLKPPDRYQDFVAK